MHRLSQLLRGKGRQPGPFVVAAGADLGDERQIVPVRMKRLADQLVSNMRTIKIAGINVVHPGCHRFAQHVQRGLLILRWTKNARPGELHRTVAQSFHRARAERVSPAFINAAHVDLPHKNDPDLQQVPSGSL